MTINLDTLGWGDVVFSAHDKKLYNSDGTWEVPGSYTCLDLDTSTSTMTSPYRFRQPGPQYGSVDAKMPCRNCFASLIKDFFGEALNFACVFPLIGGLVCQALATGLQIGISQIPVPQTRASASGSSSS